LIAVAGSSGLIGRALVDALRHDGNEVLRLVRREPSAAEVRWDPERGALETGALDGCDAVVNLCGVGLGDRRWSPERKRAILDSRVRPTSLLSKTLAAVERPPAVLVNASAIGFYGDRRDEVLTEQSASGGGFTAEVCRAWEGATAAAEEAGIRVVHLRSAVVIASGGGALARQLTLFRLGLGGRLGKGDQWFSWISLRDEVSVIQRLLSDTSLSGAVNASAPNPVTNSVFTRALGRSLHRPAALRVPRAVLALALGGQLTDELAFVSQRVLPARLEAAGFSFADPSIDQALAWALSRG
jgi:uncharacterized protein